MNSEETFRLADMLMQWPQHGNVLENIDVVGWTDVNGSVGQWECRMQVRLNARTEQWCSVPFLYVGQRCVR
jgi:hypothetical protein